MADIKINVQVVEGQAKAAVAGLEKQTRAADSAFKSLNLTIKQTSQATSVFLGNLATKAFSSAVDSLKQFGAAIGHTAVEVDTLKAKLTTLTGSSQQAEVAFRAIAKISDESPFELKQVGEAAEKLLALGVETSKLEPILKNLGDVATASGANLTELSIAFGKVSATGVLTGRELSAFQNNAIPIVDALAKTLGKTAGEAKKLANEGKISFGQFEQALQSLGKEGGFAFGAMERQSKTLEGRIKTVNDAFEEIRINVGEKLTPAFKAILTAVATLVKSFGSFISATSSVSSAGDILITSFNAVVQTITFLYNSIQGIRFVLTGLSAGFVAVIGDVIGFAEVMVKTASAVAAFTGADTTKIDEFASKIEALKDTTNSFAEDLNKSADGIATDMAFASQQADAFSDNVTAAFGKEVEAAKLAEQETGASIDRRKAKHTELTEAQLEEQRKQLENQIKFNDALLAEQQRGDAAKLEQVLIADGELSSQEELVLLQEADRQARLREARQLADSQRLGDKQATTLLAEKIEADSSVRQLNIDKKSNEIKKKLREDEVKNRADTFATIATLSDSNNRTLAAIGKASALAQIAISGPEAVAKALAAAPPPFNFALAAAVGAAIAAQTAKVVGVKFADGGIVPGNSFNGDKVSARLNSGEMVLNKSQQANLFNMANSGGSGGQVIEIHNVVELDGEVVGRSVSRQVANGLKLGEVV